MRLQFQKKAIIFLALIIGLFFTDFLFLNSLIGSKIFKIAEKPLGFAKSKLISAASFTRVFVETKNIQEENKTLRQQNDKLSADISKLNDVEQENSVLRTRLGIPPPEHRQLIFASIYNLRGNDQISGFMINKGKDDGLEEGMAVITAENILAGIISIAYDKSALVLMPESKELAINVSVQGRKVLARSHGNDSGAMLDFVTSQDELHKEDIVVTAGFGKIPASIPVFKITGIEENGSDLFKRVMVSQIFDIFSTNRVFVIK